MNTSDIDTLKAQIVYPEFEPFAKYDHWPFHGFIYVILKSSSNIYQVRSGVRKSAPPKAKSTAPKVHGRNQNIGQIAPAEGTGGGNGNGNDGNDAADAVIQGIGHMSIAEGKPKQ
jgi:hypothetical protein